EGIDCPRPCTTMRNGLRSGACASLPSPPLPTPRARGSSLRARTGRPRPGGARRSPAYSPRIPSPAIQPPPPLAQLLDRRAKPPALRRARGLRPASAPSEECFVEAVLQAPRPSTAVDAPRPALPGFGPLLAATDFSVHGARAVERAAR